MREDSLSMNQPAPLEPERTSCVEETMQDVFDAVQGGLSVYRCLLYTSDAADE